MTPQDLQDQKICFFIFLTFEKFSKFFGIYLVLNGCLCWNIKLELRLDEFIKKNSTSLFLLNKLSIFLKHLYIIDHRYQ